MSPEHVQIQDLWALRFTLNAQQEPYVKANLARFQRYKALKLTMR